MECMDGWEKFNKTSLPEKNSVTVTWKILL